MNCIVFLSFDGVTHPESCSKDHFFCQLPLIENVLREYKYVNIVISSGWRYRRCLPELQLYFSPDVRPRVISAISNLVRVDDKDCRPFWAPYRESACRWWMEELNQPRNTPWLAIDSVSELFEPDCEHLLITRSEFGFQPEHAAILREMLEARKKPFLLLESDWCVGIGKNELKMMAPFDARCIGALLGTAVGDIVGANVEAFCHSETLQEHDRLVTSLGSPARPMGVFTDDPEMAIDLAASLVSCGALDGNLCATAYAKAFVKEPRQGNDPSDSRILKMLAESVDFRTKGRPAIHPQGSYANGGAMRIAPVGVGWRNADEDSLYRAVENSLLCTNVHPEAVDGAFILAKAISEICGWNSASNTRVAELLVYLRSIARTKPMRLRMDFIVEGLTREWSDEMFLSMACTSNEFSTKFQIRAAEAAACALWAFAKEWSRPKACMIRAVMLGGDTDTVGAMAGALAGALHGVDGIPHQWYQAMENRPAIGRDYLMDVGRRLETLDMHGCYWLASYHVYSLFRTLVDGVSAPSWTRNSTLHTHE